MKARKNKRKYEAPDIRAMQLNMPKKIDKKTINEIINILSIPPVCS